MKKMLLITLVLIFYSTKMNGMLGGFGGDIGVGDTGLMSINSDLDLAGALKDFLNTYEKNTEMLDKNSKEYADAKKLIRHMKREDLIGSNMKRDQTFLDAYEQYVEKIDKNSEEYTEVKQRIFEYQRDIEDS